MQALGSALLLVVHLASGLLAVALLFLAWRGRDALQLMFGIWLPITFVVVALVAWLSAVETRRTWQSLRLGQSPPNFGVRLRGLLYVALAYLVLELFVLRIEESFLVLTGAVLAYGSYVLWTRLLPRLQRRFSPRLRRGLDIVCMNVCLTLVLCELGLRAVAVLWPTPLLVTPSSSEQTRLVAARLAPYSLRFGFPANRTGHYDTEFVPRFSNPKQALVVSIGDSFSVSEVPHALHFTTVCEQQLPGVDVYNMGIAGIGPSEYLYLLKHEALSLQPDLLVVNLFLGNDLTDGPTYQGPPRWHDVERYLTPIVLQRLQTLRRERDFIEWADRRGEPSPGRSMPTEAAGQSLEDLLARYPDLIDPFLERPTFRQSRFLQIERDRAQAVCGSNEYSEFFFQKLVELQQAAGGIPLAFVLIPDEFQVEDSLWDQIVRTSDIPLDRDRPQRELVQWLDEREIPYLDLLPVFRSVAALKDGNRHLYRLQNTHFNARGNDAAGRAIAGFVKSELAKDERLCQQLAALPMQFKFGDASLRRWMQRGWHRDEASDLGSYAWSDGLQSVLTIPLAKGRDVQMSFNCRPFAYPNSPQQTVAVVLNGKQVALISLHPQRQTYTVTLPDSQLHDRRNYLEFRYAYARQPRDVLPASEDERPLSVCWYSIDFY